MTGSEGRLGTTAQGWRRSLGFPPPSARSPLRHPELGSGSRVERRGRSRIASGDGAAPDWIGELRRGGKKKRPILRPAASIVPGSGVEPRRRNLHRHPGLDPGSAFLPSADSEGGCRVGPGMTRGVAWRLPLRTSGAGRRSGAGCRRTPCRPRPAGPCSCRPRCRLRLRRDNRRSCRRRRDRRRR